MVSEVVTILPDGESSGETGFSGLVVVRDWDWNFKKGFEHWEGEILAIQEVSGSEGARVTGEMCSQQVTDWYTCAAVVGVRDWTCHYNYTEVTEVC